MKVKPVTIITKHIKPISLTPALSKLAEEFVVHKCIGPAVLELIDPWCLDHGKLYNNLEL